MRSSLLLTLLWSLPLVAQTTHVVDALGGAGVFTTLQAAIHHADHGDVILVRPTGTYDFSLYTHKGVTIIGDGATPVMFTGVIHVVGLLPHRQFVLRGVRSAGLVTAPAGAMSVIACAGLVAIENVMLTGDLTGRGSPALSAFGASRVMVNTSYLLGGPGVDAVFARIALAQTTVRGLFGNSALMGEATPAVVARRCLMQTTGCSIFGGSTFGSFDPHPALVLDDTGARLSGGDLVAGSEPPAVAPAAVLMGSSTFERDAALMVHGGIVGGTATLTESGRVTLVAATAGTAGYAILSGPSLSFGALAVSLPAPPMTTPLGVLWCDPDALVVLAMAPVPFQVPWTVPLTAPTCIALTAQGFLVHQGSCRLSNPVTTVVPCIGR